MTTATSGAKAPSSISPTFRKLKALYPKRGDEALTGFARRIDELEKEHGDCAWIITDDGRLLVFRRPELEEWEDTTERIRGGERVGVAYRELAMTTVVEPAQGADLVAVFKRWPGLPARIGDAMLVLVGAAEALTVKKD